MNLVITNNNGIFEIEGVLDKYNLYVFRKEFQNIFEKVNNLTINIKELEKIDVYGVNALAKLHNEALMKEKSFKIIGIKAKSLNTDSEIAATSEAENVSWENIFAWQ